jgi:hypothetical protein
VPGNDAALALLRSAGRTVSTAWDDGAYLVVIELEPELGGRLLGRVA